MLGGPNGNLCGGNLMETCVLGPDGDMCGGGTDGDRCAEGPHGGALMGTCLG